MKDTKKGREWVRLLRSGQYTQGYGVLEQTGWGDPTELKHCCLGVMVAGVLNEACLGQLMPTRAQSDQFGLTVDEVGACSGLNDTRHLSFHQIATVLEAAMNDDLTVGNAYDALYRDHDGVIPSTLATSGA